MDYGPEPFIDRESLLNLNIGLIWLGPFRELLTLGIFNV